MDELTQCVISRLVAANLFAAYANTPTIYISNRHAGVNI